ncbi:hypothetical protein HAZT_HAZT000903 [Hyalella azteca]|uniref:Ubiquitin-like protease family profile domain-containing protein n=1 Tax=Hyalella azteca TaxID=294128 RepID=A0A6A0GVW2_HYAAZ|nr:hypothetical protein HAZT_HAZT000903 [Hyalella azteca]
MEEREDVIIGLFNFQNLPARPQSLLDLDVVSDELYEVGGVEIMPSVSTLPRRSVLKTSSSAALTRQSPRRAAGTQRYYGTPHPRASINRRDGLQSGKSSPVLLDLDSEDNADIHVLPTPAGFKTKDIGEMAIAAQRHRKNHFTPAISKSRLTFDEHSSHAKSQQSNTPQIKVGGNDGLTDSDDEVMDGIENDNCDGRDLVGSVEIVDNFKSPSLSKFQFHPTITSTTERKMSKGLTRKENKFQLKSSRSAANGSLLRRNGRISARLALEPLRGVSNPFSRPRSSQFSSCMPSGRPGIFAKKGLSRMGLPEAYFSSARDCYKPADKQQYLELVKQVAALGSTFYGSSTSGFSTSSVSSVPVTKTIMGADWSRRKALEIEENAGQRKKTALNEISLWTDDQESMKLSGVDSVRDDVKPKAFVLQTEKNVKNKSADKEVDLVAEGQDDDLIITKENIKKVVRLNSFEQHSKFSIFKKFNEGWIQDVKSRRLQKEAELERPLRESQETLKLGFERRRKTPSIEDVVNRRFQMLDMRHPAARIELKEEDVLVELTPKMENVISNALRKHPPGEVLTEKFNIQITRRDIATLDGLNWLNDEVVNFYMNLIMERSQSEKLPSVYAFNTFFYPKLIKMGFSGVKRWTKKIDIFSYDLLLVPVHLGMHWCLATIDTQQRVICYYDSMLGDNPQCLHELRKYLADESMDKKKSAIDLSGWKYETPKDIPQQMNGSDCGMFACKFSEYLSRRKPITFTQDHMPYFRRRMVYEIVTNKLL